MATVRVMPLKAWSDYEVSGPKDVLKNVPDGHFCTLECGCVIRRMTVSPKACDLINVWVHVPCEAFAARYSRSPNTKKRQGECFNVYPVRQLAGGVLSTNLPGFTGVAYDPLASALSRDFE